MTPLEMIAEWRKGCGNVLGLSPGAGPEHCAECTLALINALEKRLREPLWKRMVRIVWRNHA